MINFTQYLNEARMAPLYHGTGQGAAREIIETKIIMATTSHYNYKLLTSKTGFKGDLTKGVSTTREFKFAANWGSVVFELDQIKMMQKFKILPINYWQNSTVNMSAKPKGVAEFEEFVITNKGIPLSFVSRIMLNQAWWDMASDESQLIYEKTGIPLVFYNRRSVVRNFRA